VQNGPDGRRHKKPTTFHHILTHKYWRGVAGQLGHDFEVRETGTPGKGMGVFALRYLAKNDNDHGRKNR
jgi:hypothetical protein